MRDGRRLRGMPARTARTALAVLVSLSALASCSSIAPGDQSARSIHEIGTPLTDQDLAAWNIDIAPDGRGLRDP